MSKSASTATALRVRLRRAVTAATAALTTVTLAITLTGAGVATAHTSPSAPSAPTLLTATPGNASVTLTWNAPANNSGAVTDYQFQLNSDGNWRSLATTGTTATASNIPNFYSYSITIRAVTATHNGDESNPLTFSLIPVVSDPDPPRLPPTPPAPPTTPTAPVAPPVTTPPALPVSVTPHRLRGWKTAVKKMKKKNARRPGRHPATVRFPLRLQPGTVITGVHWQFTVTRSASQQRKPWSSWRTGKLNRQATRARIPLASASRVAAATTGTKIVLRVRAVNGTHTGPPSRASFRVP